MAEEFHKRFNIKVKEEEARRRFMNRVFNVVFEDFISDFYSGRTIKVVRFVASELGERYDNYKELPDYVGNDFMRHLHAIEAIYDFARNKYQETTESRELSNVIDILLKTAEIDLGVRWQNGHFIPAGAGLLDKELVNESLDWLDKQGHETVLAPFQKGLDHFLHSMKRPELLSDVVTDMYEALEALAKIMTGRDKDLSANRQMFISKVNASEAYKKILKEYIEYANKFRHAREEGKPKPKIKSQEAESFMYLTGLFIRLAMSSEKP